MPVTPGRDRRYFDPDRQPKPVTQRPCLCCRREFGSEGAGNRLCPACYVRVSDVSPYAP